MRNNPHSCKLSHLVTGNAIEEHVRQLVAQYRPPARRARPQAVDAELRARVDEALGRDLATLEERIADHITEHQRHRLPLLACLRDRERHAAALTETGITIVLGAAAKAHDHGGSLNHRAAGY
jgi:hypothetical protein